MHGGGLQQALAQVNDHAQNHQVADGKDGKAVDDVVVREVDEAVRQAQGNVQPSQADLHGVDLVA